MEVKCVDRLKFGTVLCGHCVIGVKVKILMSIGPSMLIAFVWDSFSLLSLGTDAFLEYYQSIKEFLLLV